MIKYLFLCSFLLLDNMLIFKIFYRVDSRCMNRKKEEEEVERDCRGRAGRKAAKGGLVGAYSEGGRASLLMASPRGPN